MTYAGAPAGVVPWTERRDLADGTGTEQRDLADGTGTEQRDLADGTGTEQRDLAAVGLRRPLMKIGPQRLGLGSWEPDARERIRATGGQPWHPWQLPGHFGCGRAPGRSIRDNPGGTRLCRGIIRKLVVWVLGLGGRLIMRMARGFNGQL